MLSLTRTLLSVGLQEAAVTLTMIWTQGAGEHRRCVLEHVHLFGAHFLYASDKQLTPIAPPPPLLTVHTLPRSSGFGKLGWRTFLQKFSWKVAPGQRFISCFLAQKMKHSTTTSMARLELVAAVLVAASRSVLVVQTPSIALRAKSIFLSSLRRCWLHLLTNCVGNGKRN